MNVVLVVQITQLFFRHPLLYFVMFFFSYVNLSLAPFICVRCTCCDVHVAVLCYWLS